MSKNYFYKTFFFLLIVFFLLTAFTGALENMTKEVFGKGKEKLLHKIGNNNVDTYLRKNYGFGLEDDLNYNLKCNENLTPSKITRFYEIFFICEPVNSQGDTMVLSFGVQNDILNIAKETALLLVNKKQSLRGDNLDCRESAVDSQNKMQTRILSCSVIINNTVIYFSTVYFYPIKIYGVGNAIVVFGSTKESVQERLEYLIANIIYLSLN